MNWREKLFDAQKGACWLCGHPMSLDPREKFAFATFDHIQPKVHGGSRAPINVMMAHALCNHQRGHEAPFCIVPRIDPLPLQWPAKPVLRPVAPGVLPFSSAWLQARGYMEDQS